LPCCLRQRHSARIRALQQTLTAAHLADKATDVMPLGFAAVAASARISGHVPFLEGLRLHPKQKSRKLE
jgi:hypothetical protein